MSLLRVFKIDCVLHQLARSNTHACDHQACNFLGFVLSFRACAFNFQIMLIQNTHSILNGLISEILVEKLKVGKSWIITLLGVYKEVAPVVSATMEYGPMVQSGV